MAYLRLPFEKMQRITDFTFDKKTHKVSHPDEILDGWLIYKGEGYYFKFNHDFDCGNTYVVFDEKMNPVYYFMLYFNEKSGKIDSLEMEP